MHGCDSCLYLGRLSLFDYPPPILATMEQLLTQVAKKYQDAFNRSTRTERTALVRIWAEEIMTPPLMMDAKTTSDRLLTLMEETFCKNVLIPYKRGKDCSAILGNQRLNEMFKIRKKDCLTIDRSVHMRMVQDVCETILAEGIQFWQENRDGTWIQLEKFDDTEKDQVFHLALTVRENRIDALPRLTVSAMLPHLSPHVLCSLLCQWSLVENATRGTRAPDRASGKETDSNHMEQSDDCH